MQFEEDREYPCRFLGWECMCKLTTQWFYYVELALHKDRKSGKINFLGET